MKSLLATPITRTRQCIGDWIPAEQHTGVSGAAAFAARIEAVRKIVQGNTPQAKVRELRRK